MQNTRYSHNYAGSYNWGKPQPMQLGDNEAYIEAAYERRLAYRAILEDFAKAAGPGVEIIPPCVKSHASANRKLWDRTSSSTDNPDMIVDYLRARLLVPANPGMLGQFNDAVDRFKDHGLMVGYKDRIFRPNGSGFRAINGLFNIEGLHTEFQIIPDDRFGRTRIANEITEALRGSERAFRLYEETHGSKPDSSHKMVSKAEKSIGHIRNLRTALHEDAAQHTGLNAWLDPAIAHKHTAPTLAELSDLYRVLGRDYFGRGASAKIAKPMESLLTAAREQQQQQLAYH